ncbi:YjjG family noncanonical pyrimidine nucleotidase [Fructobacillus fructosus]|uniref:YjjG family noncanonical pyrimidine nucleotidase n=1 Tax=Fructobacillus fructosus TaxID=1631 RepID=UPI002D9B1CBD|nr:FMN and 5-amino-6-(5-phospho-D-ribitylamino)uracil phosphatase YigB [Fructobacillus fructosus]CAK1228286.1 FMN and 5-amino-6-(5-phospho-D-ribitylamino)uracil phosphatase YigB [Fructobacillus fructosus]CAK1228427.1 FMN and 5-amino-6-(5-phospho-D-ribitylamino)uracil phosphatase YigB [Fructobacillus fructosus]
MSIKNLIFDLDDTLLDFKGGEVADIKELFATHCHLEGPALEKALATYQGINSRLWYQYEMKEIDREEIFTSRFPKTLAALGLTEQANAKQLEEDYAYLRDHNYRMLDGAKELLETLSKRYTLFAGTNGQEETQYRRLKATGLLPYFTKVYTSEGLGVAKPDASFFEKIFSAEAAVQKEETIMIGDGLYSDILGGQNAQMATIWVNLKHKELPTDIHPSKQVHSLNELAEIL